MTFQQIFIYIHNTKHSHTNKEHTKMEVAGDLTSVLLILMILVIRIVHYLLSPTLLTHDSISLI